MILWTANMHKYEPICSPPLAQKQNKSLQSHSQQYLLTAITQIEVVHFSGLSLYYIDFPIEYFPIDPVYNIIAQLRHQMFYFSFSLLGTQTTNQGREKCVDKNVKLRIYFYCCEFILLCYVPISFFFVKCEHL